MPICHSADVCIALSCFSFFCAVVAGHGRPLLREAMRTAAENHQGIHHGKHSMVCVCVCVSVCICLCICVCVRCELAGCLVSLARCVFAPPFLSTTSPPPLSSHLCSSSFSSRFPSLSLHTDQGPVKLKDDSAHGAKGKMLRCAAAAAAAAAKALVKTGGMQAVLVLSHREPAIHCYTRMHMCTHARACASTECVLFLPAPLCLPWCAGHDTRAVCHVCGNDIKHLPRNACSCHVTAAAPHTTAQFLAKQFVLFL